GSRGAGAARSRRRVSFIRQQQRRNPYTQRKAQGTLEVLRADRSWRVGPARPCQECRRRVHRLLNDFVDLLFLVLSTLRGDDAYAHVYFAAQYRQQFFQIRKSLRSNFAWRDSRLQFPVSLTGSNQPSAGHLSRSLGAADGFV